METYTEISCQRDAFDMLVFTLVRTSDEKVLKVGVDFWSKLQANDQLI